MVNNYHVLIVKYVGATNYTGSRVKIISERFKQSITIGYDHQFNSAVDIAEDWLVKNGYVLTGKGEGKDHMYILSTTFEPLKSFKN